MNKRRNLLLVVGGIIAIIIIAIVVSREQSNQLAVQVQTVKIGHFQITLPETGFVQHPQVETIPALISGNLSGLYVQAGDEVSAGELLATIYNIQITTNASGSAASYQAAVAGIQQAQSVQQNTAVNASAQVATALSNLDEAQRTYRANLNLYNNKAISRDTLDQAKAKLDQDQVAYDQAVKQQRLNAISLGGQSSVAVAQAQAQKSASDAALAQTQASQTRVVAPFAGQIQTVTAQASDPTRPMQVGDAVTQGQTLFTIAGNGGFIVRTQVDEQDISQVRVGQRAVVSGEDFNGASFPGHVSTIAPTAQKSTDTSSTTRQVLTTIALDSNSSLLKDGLTADVDIITTDIANTVTVPNSAIVTTDGKKYVWVVRDRQLHKVPVQTGPSNDTVTVVRSGVNTGDSVTSAPLPVFSEGMYVSPVH